MAQDYTHISILLDRTGSMQAIRDDIIGGFNAFLQEQQKLPGRATLTLVQFDSQDPYEVIHSFLPIELTPELTAETFVPRASTPLYDALGRGIVDLEAQVGRLRGTERPDRVVLAVITDGRENSSREFSRHEVCTMVRQKQEAGWQFVFLSADLDAFAEARAVGISRDATMRFSPNANDTRLGWETMTTGISRFRTGRIDRIKFDEPRRERGPEQPGVTPKDPGPDTDQPGQSGPAPTEPPPGNPRLN